MKVAIAAWYTFPYYMLKVIDTSKITQDDVIIMPHSLILKPWCFLYF